MEDRRFLIGQGRYVNDAIPAGTLHAVFVRSPHAHARIGSINAAGALRMDGLHAVLTAADMATEGAGLLPCAMTFAADRPLIVPPRHPLAVGTVRYVGEAVAMVVADNLALARDAAEQVLIDYDALPSVTGLSEAVSTAAPLLWPQAPGNEAYRFRRGDREAVAAAFAQAAHIVELTLVNNRVVAAAMEPRGAVAVHDPASGRLHLRLSGQDVHGIRRDLADCLGLPSDMIHVACEDVGGGFGMKNVLYPEFATLLLGARRLGRPLCWIADRTEEFTSGVHGRDNLTATRLALDAMGRFLALDVTTLANLGAYVSSLGPGAQTTAPMSAMGGLYAIPAISMDVRGIFTNTVPVDAYRGAGKPEANYVIERLIDAAAAQTGLDRIALRRLNLIRTFPYTGALGITIDTGQFHANLDAALVAADHARLSERKTEAVARGRLVGQGIACFLETSRGQPTEEGAIRFHADGTADLLIGSQSNGQGLATSFAQIAAERLGLPMESFRLVQADTDRIAKGGGHGGARSLVMAGTALRMAIDMAMEKAFAEAARLLQAERSQIKFESGAFRLESGASVGFATMIQGLPPGTLDADARNPNDQYVFPNGCHVAEVELDPETGIVSLLRYVAVDDFGIVLNPLLTEGQVQGGLAQGIGQAMMERVHYDLESGQLMTASFSDYALPRASDMPWLEVAFNEHPTSRNVLGAKGAGQAGAIAAPQVIMCAIADAIGNSPIDMPATPERIWRACRSGR